jgi:hypothetical protein
VRLFPRIVVPNILPLGAEYESGCTGELSYVAAVLVTALGTTLSITTVVTKALVCNKIRS